MLSITGKGFTCYAFFVAANFAFRTLRLRKVQTCAVAAPLHKNLFSENIFVRNMVILICAGALWGKSELTRVKPKALKIASREVRACVMPTAAVRLRRMPELKKLPYARQFLARTRGSTRVRQTSRSLVAAAFSLNLTAKIFAFAKRFA